MKGCAITPRCDVSDAKAERGREFDRVSNYEDKEESEERGRNKLPGNTRGGTNARKGVA